MTAEAVEAVLGVEDGARWLRMAVRKGLFITVTGSSPKSYEYHPLFREHLWSAFVGKRAKRLRGYAADYLAAHGQEDVAVELYFKGGLPRKARLLIESASRGMRAQGRLDTLQKWDGLLESHGITSARLLLRLSYLLADQGRQPEARDAWRRASKSADVHSDEWVSFELRLQDGWLKLYGGDTKGSRGIALKCCRDLKYSRATPGFREEAFRLLALSHLFEGNVTDAAIYSRETVRISRRWAPFRRGQALLAHWAVMSYAGRTKDTERARTAYLALPPNEMGPYHQLAMYVGVATDAAYEGRFEEAIQIIGEGLAAARDLGSEVEEALLLVTLADLYSDSGRPASSLVVYERVAQLLNPSGEENWRTYVSFREAIALRRAGRDRTRVMEAQGRRSPRFRRAWRGDWDVEILMEEALQRPEYSLRRLGRMAAQESTAMRRILIGAHCAQILAETGRTGQAAVRLEECLHLADECGMPALLAGEISASSDLRSVGRGELAGNRLWAKLEEMLARGRRLPEFVLSSAGMTSARNPLVIEGLGRLRVMWSGDILEFKPKPLEVLLFIADRGSVPQDVLMEAFWGHLDPRRQAANLHSAMYSLRRRLGKRAIRVSSSVISFDAHFEVDYDVLTFLRESSMALSPDRRRAGRLVVLQRATELYAGAFAPILDSEWARARRAGLQNVFSDLALALGETSLAEGVSSTAIPKLRLALEGEPYREDLATMLVRCLKAAGRKAEALHAASDFARLQMNDLGLHAGPDLAELIASLRRREESEEVTDAGYVVSAIANGT
jgi:DNA-binding SARP family transcriptional activator/tetratricopeptide (TPR) repeat protein